MSNWEKFDEADDVPFLTTEERKRLQRNFKRLQDRCDPIGAKLRDSGYIPFTRREDDYDMGKKIRDAEDAAGWPRSSPY